MPTLTDLPQELVYYIGELTVEDEDSPNPTCAVLALTHPVFVPFARGELFPDIVVSSQADLRALATLAKVAPAIISSVQTVEIDLSQGKEQAVKEEEEQALRALLKGLNRLQDFSTINSPRAADLVLSEPVASKLRNLNEFNLVDAFLPNVNSFRPSRFKHLFQLPYLDYLEIIARPNPPFHHLASLPFPVPPSSSLCSGTLNVEGRLENAASYLVASFASLHGLAVDDMEPSPSRKRSILPSVLRHVISPQDLVFLALSQESGHRQQTLYDSLATFENLEELHLSGNAFEEPMLAYAASLPKLTILVFGEGAWVAPGSILALVEGPHRPPALQQLYLDHVRAKEDVYGHGDIVWPGDYTYDVVRRILDAARSAGVEIEGKLAEFAREEGLIWTRRMGG
ncbi:hypothetical protein JCM8547_008904 [Rhodosporidiobolus lusitaniae]